MEPIPPQSSTLATCELELLQLKVVFLVSLFFEVVRVIPLGGKCSGKFCISSYCSRHEAFSSVLIKHLPSSLRIARGILQLLRAIFQFHGTQAPKLRPSCTHCQKVASNFWVQFWQHSTKENCENCGLSQGWGRGNMQSDGERSFILCFPLDHPPLQSWENSREMLQWDYNNTDCKLLIGLMWRCETSPELRLWSESRYFRRIGAT